MDKYLKEKFFIDFIYSSSVVEGVKLTRAQVKSIVQKGKRSKYLKNNPSDALLQALGQRQALESIEKWAKLKSPITTQALLTLHDTVFHGVDITSGRFRSSHVVLRSSKLMPSFPFSISADMRDFNQWLLEEQKKIDPKNIKQVIEFVSRVYHTITRIHPFEDGNGRSGRLFANLFLRRYKLPHIMVPKVENAQQVRKVLRDADMGNIKPLVAFNTKLLEQSLKRFNGKIWVTS